MDGIARACGCEVMDFLDEMIAEDAIEKAQAAAVAEGETCDK